MSLDTLLNILAVILAAAAVGLAGAAAYFTYANRQAILRLPQDIAPAQAALDTVVVEAEKVARLLQDAGNWLDQYKSVLRDNSELKKQVQQLEYALGVKEGQIVTMTSQLARHIEVEHNQWNVMQKQQNAIGELVTTNEAQRRLIEEMTRALDRQKSE